MREKQNDFKQPVKDKLRQRAGNACSKPDCHAPTSGAKTGDEEGFLNMGTAAHICAASPGGPRYDSSMTAAQRSAYKNGVWLCIPCSNKIDKDPLAYPVELLHQWRRDAEQRSRDKVGRPALPDSAPRDLLVSAFSGLPLKSGLSQAIGNVHGAVEQAMNLIDQRFAIKSTYSSSGTVYYVSAKEEVSLTLEFKNAQRYAQGYRQLVEEGKTLLVDSRDLSLIGSPLFEQITAESQTVRIGSPGKPCTLKLSITNTESETVETYDDVPSQFTSGTIAASVTGYSMNKMLKLEMAMPISMRGKVSITLTPYMELWNGLPICSLPYFTKIRSLLLGVNDGHALNVKLEHHGEHLASGRSDGIAFKNQFDNIKMLFMYLDAARDIAKFTQTTILFDETETIPGEDIELLIDIAAVIKRQSVLKKKDFTKPIQISLECIADGKSQLEMLERDEDMVFRITEKEGQTIKVFGQKINMPRKTMHFSRARAAILNKNTHQKDGVIKLQIIPAEDSTLETLYLTEDEEATEAGLLEKMAHGV